MTSREKFEAWFFGSKYAQVVIPTSYTQQIWLDACAIAYAAGQEAMRERAAKVPEKRAADRTESHGIYEASTGAWYYPHGYRDIGNAMDEEDDDCATAIRALEIEK